MLSPTLTDQQQRELARNLTYFLSQYKHISDSYIIEFFCENLWATLPIGWQETLDKLSPPQIADLLLDKNCVNKNYPSVWPLSLLAFRACAHTLIFPRIPPDQRVQHVGVMKPEEFHANHSQSSLLGHIFRKHVKPKKQHEIRMLGMMVKKLCDLTSCNNVIDVGSGQGHLTRFLSFGMGLSVTAIEADPHLVTMASKFDGQLRATLEKETRKNASTSAPSGLPPCHVVGWVNPKASWEAFFEQLNKRVSESERLTSSGGTCKKRQWISMSTPGQRLTCEDLSLCPSECNPSSSAKSEHGLLQHKKANCTDPLSTASQPPQSAEAAIDLQSNVAVLSQCLCKCEKRPYHCCNTGSDLCSEKRGHLEQGFILTGLHACGDLSATLLRHFVSCPYVQGITSVACCYMKITTKESPNPPGIIASPCQSNTEETRHCQFGYPMSDWVGGLPGHELSYKAREGACHAMENYLERLREENEQVKTHCYRAVLETIIRAERPDLRRAGVQTIKKAHSLPFSEYARLGLSRLGLPADLPLDDRAVEDMLKQQGRVVAFYSLSLLLAPVVETLVLLDRIIFLQEKGLKSQLVPLFDPAFSPRNLVLVAVKLQ
ncbi:methyltransferase-like protein 25B [Denticeps clupeoides]|uniref:methyltransferase-like protein 25B n=1 Tax=Denticeps clupeoides TaxID=299321 RepID=UPI0010A4EEF0|nr:protein RRNAD1 [Denticeps clupeoides]